jgi:dethiobiotin synthase
MNIFVTGTDTDVGKTFISALLVKRWNCDYWKPLQTGLDEDPGDCSTVERLLLESGQMPSQTTIHQPAHSYRKPLSPWRCTILENSPQIDIDTFTIPTDKFTIIEGAGGVLVPITKEATTIDLIKKFDIPTIVVARSTLGTLNHTLLTLEILKAAGVKVLGVILNGEINEDNALTLKELGVNIIAQIPKAKNLNEVVHRIPSLKSLIK